MVVASAGRIRSWRSTFAALRGSSGSSEVEAVRELLLHANGLARSVHDLPSQEVSADVVHLINIVSSNWSFQSDAVDAANKVSQLIGDVSSQVQLEFKSSAALVVSRFLRGILDIQINLPETIMEELCSNTLNALAQFVYVSGHQLPSDEANAIVHSLVPFLTYQRSNGRRKANGPDFSAFLVVGNVFTRIGTSISKATWERVIQNYRKVLDRAAAQIVEDAAASRYYGAFLRSLHLVLSDIKGSFDEHVGGFVASLRVFLAYGLPGSRLNRLPDNRQLTSTATSSVAGKAIDPVQSRGSSLYRPPHLRCKQQDTASDEEGSRSKMGEQKRALFSDSEQSDNDSSKEMDHFRSSKARTNAVLTIQAIARADPKLLHAHWSLLLPTDNALHPRLSQPTLLTTLLFDPNLKTRIAAVAAVSTLLEGPARAFLQVAEYKEPGKTGSFTTLSSSLGQIIHQLHKGLLHLVLNESHSGILAGVFKALSLLVSASPYDRLPTGLLADVICSVHRRVRDLSSSPDQSLLVSGFNCLNAGLFASATSAQVEYLLVQPPVETSRDRSLFADLISFASCSPSSAVCTESLQSLKAAIHTHGALASQYWTEIFELIRGIIEHEKNSSSRAVDEKTVCHAVKLLDEALRAISGFKGAEDMFEVPILPPSPSQLPQPSKLLSCAGERAQISETSSLNTKPAGTSQWLQALEWHLPIKHYTPAIRAAALTCFAGLTPGVYSSLSQAKQLYIFSTVVDASVRDEAAPVRSAACRALGVIIGFSEVIERQDNVQSGIATVQATISDASLSVRITSCWALANICDALCKHSEKQIDQRRFYGNDPSLLTSLADIGLRAAKDGDKVRANAVRALGNLARFVDFSSPESPTYLWLVKMVQTLVSCITTGNVKVQWNVCHSLGNLFLNKTIRLQKMPWASSVYSILLLLLRDSANFKIRIHAASALAVPCNREDFGESYSDVVHGLMHALESLDTEQKAAPSNFKYISTLSEQLTSTCLHVLSLAQAEDYTALKDSLHKRSTFLYNWLQTLSTGSSSSRQLGDNAASRRKVCMSYSAAQSIGDMFEHGGDRSLSSRFKNLVKLD